MTQKMMHSGKQFTKLTQDEVFKTCGWGVDCRIWGRRQVNRFTKMTQKVKCSRPMKKVVCVCVCVCVCE